MTTVVDYQYSIPSAYTFPAQSPHTHSVSSGMVKHHPQPLTFNNSLQHGIPNPYLTTSSPRQTPSHLQVSPQFNPSSRRTNSTATAISTASGLTATTLTRSTSNGSSGSSNAYVTTLRKQKATVWCDRAQREDARLLAAQKAAKARAALEVAKAAAQHGHRSNDSTSSVHRGKISHHRGGKKGSAGLDHEFSTNRSLVAGVPARLDIDDDNSDDDQPGSGSGSQYGGITRRTNSGRSSINSVGQRRLTTTTTSSSGGGVRVGTPQLQLRIQDVQGYGNYNATNTSSPSTYSRTSSLMETAVPEVPEIVETPGTVIGDPRAGAGSRQEYFMHQQQPIYHQHRKSNSFNRPIASPSQYHPDMQLSYQSGSLHPSDSFVSSSSGESNSRPGVMRAQSSREPGDLRRKGSIDDSRTMTMGRVRLFVANPDQ
ncbi:hypothetical protein ABW19_dt0209874 [Dactylella cylindrospora]|nr:hypothetical protein ABW19_dt0209874 [Dactylella cylindrospora]